MGRSWSRRDVLKHAGSAGLMAASLGGVTRARASGPNERLNLAIVGCGGQGGENLKQVAAENIVALCDVDDRRAAEAFETFPKAERFRDYRRMLDAAHARIDAVVVSTPDHMHAPIGLAAMDLGKHVYCEKPLTWSIDEARRMARVAAERKLATQMGTQGMAGDGARAGIEALRSGVLGEVRELHVWTDRPAGWWPQGIDRPADRPPVREGLDWNLWLGVAPERPYHPAYSPFVWRGWKDFGTGAVGDMGIHNAAMPFAALELDAPISAELVATSGLKAETFPVWSRIRVEFAAKAGRGPITLHWYDGGRKPPAELVGGRKLADNGAIVVGTKGTMSSTEWTGGDWALLPEEAFRDFKAPAASVPRAPGGSHHQEWLRACRGGPPAFCRFDGFASRLTETMLVANLALRTGRRIDWDAATMTARGCPEAEPLIRRRYREGW
ncbi:Inositol 2-dehydrogenase [Aquisphaera giovannonii]|uniref:Inositol 2-dehydrogenase n=1 Tax=Aquisphaera giovannonii TaxID=406548 RepID=A0A5B9W7D3_9BACT|nr:Gfo/Idh/MocA family oxidoreductase [Aquisphaera giovannonii]QEH35840.1 Inositol 2-dehydrogenase [Aquisphaera giovannonii]